MNPSNAHEKEDPQARSGRGLSAAAVADFLRGRPDFFIDHPELLTTLALPHECGDAVSLVEYQVSVLREQNLRLRRQMDTLVTAARDNEALSERLHRLTLDLLACQDLAMALDALDDALRAGFRAELAGIRLLVPAPPGEEGRPEFLGDGAAARAVYARVLEAGAPTCGRIAPALADSLFGPAAEPGSAVVVPLGTAPGFGALAIGSRDPLRFQPGIGTLFIRQLAEVAARVIRRHLP